MSLRAVMFHNAVTESNLFSVQSGLDIIAPY